ncbi:MAG: hypothetical protein ACOC7N_04980 [Chloroflexota bacterium]
MMDWRPGRRDLLFMVDTLMPESRDRERIVELVEGDERFLESMLDDERVFERLMSGEEILLQVSPWLLFTVLLRRARRDLEGAPFTTERRSLQKVFVFDADEVAELLGEDALRGYLASTLASFTRMESTTVTVRVGRGMWRRYRTNELDVESLMRYSQALDEEQRFEPYRRIGDVCLFLSGVFPGAIEARYRYPMSGEVRPRARARTVVSREDYEAHGQAFYRLASEHERAQMQGLERVLEALSDHFILAEKALSFVADRYLGLMKQQLFEV